jgi:nucleoside-diphosphate-sugar epimerase
MRILVAGAGVLGKRLIRVFLGRGSEVVALALAQREFEGLEHPNLRAVACDVTKPEQLEGLCRGVDIVVSCIGITRLKGNLTHMDVDYRGNLNLLREAERSGVRKFGIVSPEGVDEGADHVPLLEARRLFEQELRKSSVDWLVFHAGGFFTDLAEMGKMVEKGSLFVIGHGKNVFTPIAVEDLAEIVAADMLARSRQVVHVGGPEDMSWNEICEVCFAHRGKKPRILKIPVWLCRLTLWMIKPFSRPYHAMGRLLVFMSTQDLPTEKRGRTRLADYLKANRSVA